MKNLLYLVKFQSMKSLKSIGLLTLLFSFSLFLLSCGGNSTNDKNATQTEAHHGEGKAYTSAYVCPMHCDDSGSEEAGKCPVCSMNYVAQAEHTKDGHKH